MLEPCYVDNSSSRVNKPYLARQLGMAIRPHCCSVKFNALQIFRKRGRYMLSTKPLFHHQTSTCTENVKFRAVNVYLLPGTSSGQ